MIRPGLQTRALLVVDMHESQRLPWHYEGETLVVETPEQIRLEYRIAPFATRMIAALYDRLIIGVILLAFVVVGCGLGVSVFRGESGVMVGAVLYTGFFLISQFYFVVAELRGEGRTWGKRKCGLRTVHESGRGLNGGSSLIRNIARLVDDLPVAWLVPALTKGRRRIGDMLGGTFVINEAVERPRETRWLDRLAESYSALDEKLFPLPPSAVAQLDAEDLNLIEYLAERLIATKKVRRRKMVEEIALRYVVRLGLEDREAEIKASAERFLQELGLLLRERFDRTDA